MELVRFLCAYCAQDMRQAGLVFKEAPDSGGEKDSCAWCKRRCYGRKYIIKYGGKRR